MHRILDGIFVTLLCFPTYLPLHRTYYIHIAVACSLLLCTEILLRIFDI